MIFGEALVEMGIRLDGIRFEICGESNTLQLYYRAGTVLNCLGR